MRNKLFIIVALALGVAGCSKMETGDIMPVSFDSETGVDLFSWEACKETVPALLGQNGFILGSRPSSCEIWPSGEGAVVINDQTVINGIVAKYGLDPEIYGEVDEYSLLAGYAITGNTGGYEVSQRVKRTIDGVTLGLMIEQVGIGLCTPGYAYYMALYPKLPAGPVARIYRTDVDADPGSGDSAE